MNRKELISKVKELGIETTKAPHMTKTEELQAAYDAHVSSNSNSSGNRGRKPNPNSQRQKYLAYIAERKSNGTLHQGKTGRKPNPNSKRQQYLAKKAAGLIKRGRPAKVKIEAVEA